MKPMDFVWSDGEILDNQKGGISFNQGLNYGAAIYEGIRFYKTSKCPAVFRLNEHIDRFLYSAKVLRMNLSFSKEELISGVKNGIIKNQLQEGYIRPLAFYSEPKMGINILDGKVQCLILAWPWEKREPKQVRLFTTSWKRSSPDSIDFKAKIAGYYGNNLLGFLEARENGFDEPLFLDRNNFITEGAVNNIFFVKDNILYTPTAKNILNGITRQSIIEIAKDLKIETKQKNLDLNFARGADEIFLTGTGVELEVVQEIKGIFQNKSEPLVTEKVASYYRKVARGEVPKYHHWLTYVS